MTKFALVKDGVTQNVIRLLPDATYQLPEGVELVPIDEAPVYRTAYAAYLPAAEKLIGEESISYDYIALRRTHDIAEVLAILNTSDLDDAFILMSENGVLIFRPSEPGAYLQHIYIKPEARGRGEGGSLMRAGARWMFLHTDAKIIGSDLEAGNEPAIRSTASIPGAVVLPDSVAPKAVFTIGRFAAAYGVQKFLSEMHSVGQVEKANRLGYLWNSTNTESS